MGLLDKAKEKATQIAGQAKEKLDDVKEKREVDKLLDDLGRIVYRQRTDRSDATDEAEIVRLVAELRKLEDEGAEVIPSPAAAEEATDTPAPAAGDPSTFATPE